MPLGDASSSSLLIPPMDISFGQNIQQERKRFKQEHHKKRQRRPSQYQETSRQTAQKNLLEVAQEGLSMPLSSRIKYAMTGLTEDSMHQLSLSSYSSPEELSSCIDVDSAIWIGAEVPIHYMVPV